jgi:oligopeptide/dipeptide ABC transporter ATP-binding protein
MSARLELRDAVVSYPRARSHGGPLRAVDGVSFSLEAGEILGLVGESGCGKTSIGRAILGLVPLAGGEILWNGRRIDRLTRGSFRPLRRELQLVFQDPHACLDPRMTLAQSVAEPLRALVPSLTQTGRAARAAAILEEVGLAPSLAGRFPHQLSGGQLQRAVIARALVVEPRLLVCDEPVSALDVSVQGQIVNLIARIRREHGLACLFISHNLAVVACLARRVMVMYRGRIVESAGREELIAAPLHPYTRLLLDCVPEATPARARRLLDRKPPSLVAASPTTATGCAFAARCPRAVERCRTMPPPLRRFGSARLVACHRADEWRDGVPPSADG